MRNGISGTGSDLPSIPGPLLTRIGINSGEMILDRCRHYLKNPPAHDWDGVFDITEK
jgi:hypothetical protein